MGCFPKQLVCRVLERLTDILYKHDFFIIRRNALNFFLTRKNRFRFYHAGATFLVFKMFSARTRDYP